MVWDKLLLKIKRPKIVNLTVFWQRLGLLKENEIGEPVLETFYNDDYKVHLFDLSLAWTRTSAKPLSAS